MKGFVRGTVLISLLGIGAAGFLDYKRYEYDRAWNEEFGDDGPLSSCYFQIMQGQTEFTNLTTYCVGVWVATYQEFQNEY